MKKRSTVLPFADRVRRVVVAIPKGTTMTYAQVARAAGSPRAARAVGTVMRHNFDPKVPCHRVIRSDGSLGNYNRGGTTVKRALLRKEGVVL
ncbi:MAG TPA: MGMT family protein [Candidatus Paceibacterota bacterium]|nr:MGMT family protein [Candidatus Paceibacterota bacterium]